MTRGPLNAKRAFWRFASAPERLAFESAVGSSRSRWLARWAVNLAAVA
jgi:hypothetical protein